jgi:hypothetical protein
MRTQYLKTLVRLFMGTVILAFGFLSVILLITYDNKYKILDLFSYLSLLLYPFLIFFFILYEKFQMPNTLFEFISNFFIYSYYILFLLSGFGIIKSRKWGMMLFIILIALNLVIMGLVLIGQVSLNVR